MEDVNAVAAAIRSVESNDDYRFQAVADIGGTRTRKLGAYGIVQDRWDALSSAAGIAGATWNDRGAQDYIARQSLERSYEQLGDWTMAAVAFRFGMQAATALSERNLTDPGSIEAAGQQDIAEYVRALKRGAPQPELPVTGHLNTGTNTQQTTNPTRKRSEEIVRNQLYALRNASKSSRTRMREQEVSDGSNEGQQPVGGSVVPDTAE